MKEQLKIRSCAGGFTIYKLLLVLSGCVVFFNLMCICGAFGRIYMDDFGEMAIGPSILSFIFFAVLNWLFGSAELIVTDKRVYGTAKKREVTIPLKEISSVSKLWFSGVAVGSSSGRIAFVGIANSREIYNEIVTLITAEKPVQEPQNINKLTNAQITNSQSYDDLPEL